MGYQRLVFASACVVAWTFVISGPAWAQQGTLTGAVSDPLGGRVA